MLPPARGNINALQKRGISNVEIPAVLGGGWCVDLTVLGAWGQRPDNGLAADEVTDELYSSAITFSLPLRRRGLGEGQQGKG